MLKLQPKWGRRKYSCRPRPFSRLFWPKRQPGPSGLLGQLEGISIIYRQDPLFRRCLSTRPLECPSRFRYFVLGLFWVLVVFVFLAISQHKWPGRMGMDAGPSFSTLFIARTLLFLGFIAFSCFWNSNIYRQDPLVFRVHCVFVFLAISQHKWASPTRVFPAASFCLKNKSSWARIVFTSFLIALWAYCWSTSFS